MTPEQIAEILRQEQAHGVGAPLLIMLNGEEYLIGQQLPEKIEYLNVSCGVFAPQAHPSQVPLIKQWLNKVMDKFTGEYATYNGILVPRADLVKFEL